MKFEQVFWLIVVGVVVSLVVARVLSASPGFVAGGSGRSGGGVTGGW